MLRDRVFADVSPTFRRGRTGQWREVFDAELRDVCKRELGPLLIRYGYESTNEWADG